MLNYIDIKQLPRQSGKTTHLVNYVALNEIERYDEVIFVGYTYNILDHLKKELKELPLVNIHKYNFLLFNNVTRWFRGKRGRYLIILDEPFFIPDEEQNNFLYEIETNPSIEVDIISRGTRKYLTFNNYIKG